MNCLTILVYKIRYCAETMLVQILYCQSEITYDCAVDRLKPLKPIKITNGQICVPVMISNIKYEEEEKMLSKLFYKYLYNLEKVQLSDKKTLSGINWTRLIAPIEQRFEDVAQWNRNQLLGLPPPSWMVPEEVEATLEELRGGKNSKNK